MLPFLVFGVENLYKNFKLRRFFYIYNIFVFFWSYQALGVYYYLKPDKIRGLSLTSYNFMSVMVWSYLIIIFLSGLLSYIKSNSKYINYKDVSNNFLFVSIFLIIFGYLGSSMPLINFLNFYFFGQTKFGTNNYDLFSQTQWGKTLLGGDFFRVRRQLESFLLLQYFYTL